MERENWRRTVTSAVVRRASGSGMLDYQLSLENGPVWKITPVELGMQVVFGLGKEEEVLAWYECMYARTGRRGCLYISSGHLGFTALGYDLQVAFPSLPLLLSATFPSCSSVFLQVLGPVLMPSPSNKAPISCPSTILCNFMFVWSHFWQPKSSRRGHRGHRNVYLCSSLSLNCGYI